MNVREPPEFDTTTPINSKKNKTESYNSMAWGYLTWYVNLNSYKYLKSETHLRNVLVNKDSSVDKGIVKICPVASMVRKNWSWIVVASCGLHYFVSACFGSFWVFANSTAERFKYLLFSSMKIHIMACIVKKQNNFILSCLVT